MFEATPHPAVIVNSDTYRRWMDYWNRAEIHQRLSEEFRLRSFIRALTRKCFACDMAGLPDHGRVLHLSERNLLRAKAFYEATSKKSGGQYVLIGFTLLPRHGHA